MSSLKVLTLGDNPNILLYTSRFQLANSVDLYHISNTDSNVFEIETHAYGTERLVLKNHYRSVNLLTEKLNGSEQLIYDVIMLGASSLQELSALSNDLTEYMNSSTKVFIESTGFVQLESFVKMSMNVPHLNIFSILTDFDIRETSRNTFKQFRTNNLSSSTNTIYLGDSSVKTSDYAPVVVNLLKTFERLFQKLFPRDTINLCNENPSRFLTTQWNIALPIICFDPLLILLEETDPQHLKDQILAKPLISGLVSEVLRITKSMKLKLTWDNEKDLLNNWGETYSIHNSMPSLLYHFIHKTAPLNFDIILLQVILLADDFNLKTPYLEFLYSTMIQIQKLNDNKSKWFIRSENINQSNTEVENLTSQNEMNLTKIQELNNTINKDQSQLQILKTSETNLKHQLDLLKGKLQSFEKENAGLISKHANEIKILQMELQKSSLNESNDEQPLTNNDLNGVKQVQEYNLSGTPIMHDLQDFAGYGVNYADSPAQMNKSPTPQPNNRNFQQNDADNSNGNRLDIPVSNHSETKSTSGSDTSLKERELELRKKELELQERELDMQRKAMQIQMRGFSNQQQSQPQQFNGASRKSSYVNMQQQQQQQQQPQAMQNGYGRSSRMLHGATAPSATVSAGEFMDPISSTMGYNNSNYNNYQGQMNPNQQYQAHGFKPTSRKNRNSNMPLLGSASSAPGTAGSFGTYNRPQNGSASQPNLNQSRIGSMTSQNLLAGQARNRPAQNVGPYTNNSRNNNVAPGMNSTSMASLQQRQTSAMSVSNNGDPNTTSNTVIHNVQSASTNNVTGLKQTYAPVTLSQGTSGPSKMNISGGSMQGQSQSPIIPASPDVSSVADQSSSSHDDKKKKKKFGFFKKKSKN
ncbi:similar to Saccharomyces cerevisiae YDR251W PAM1 Essential protein of unknown function [Maudiozyma saulgeensis]|uniref:Ketopantoate reductase C-terminal domain-containing protein n=1 Tax=Maudiozyma saulgeensis TaxID=1789683 RepID=A0A1X7RC47_9SACH|nr:similar to Saccharomyces cerevisiae YDR251W PAM1 Essential protein of unknown function [Kazachstania saulgeensis]